MQNLLKKFKSIDMHKICNLIYAKIQKLQANILVTLSNLMLMSPLHTYAKIYKKYSIL